MSDDVKEARERLKETGEKVLALVQMLETERDVYRERAEGSENRARVAEMRVGALVLVLKEYLNGCLCRGHDIDAIAAQARKLVLDLDR